MPEGGLPRPLCSPLSTLWRGQDGIWQRHLPSVWRKATSRLCVIDGSVGKQHVVLHTAKQEGGEGDDKQELPGKGAAWDQRPFAPRKPSFSAMLEPGSPPGPQQQATAPPPPGEYGVASCLPAILPWPKRWEEAV